MWNSIVEAIRDFGLQWSKLSVSKKSGVFALLVVIGGCLLMFGAWVGEKSYTPLYNDLQPENSIALVKFLQQERIPYLVSQEGKTVSIPPEFVQQTLMKLAIQGMPAGNKPGLEIFDKESFGTSSYVQRINYVRALQGELTRTISTLRAVRKSTVHISMPPKTSFLETSEEPKASVVIELHPGADINKDEVKGIQNLVAFSVEGLRANRVTVVDSTGRSLSTAGSEMSALSSTLAEREKNVEKSLEERIETMLSKMYGQGNVIARVNAELDFDPLKEQETLYDPEQSALKVQNKQDSNMEAKRPEQGPAPAGVAAALPGAAPEAPAAPSTAQSVVKTSDRSEYEVSRKVLQREKALGGVKRLTVAVLLKSEMVKDSKGVMTSKPIDEGKRTQILKLVQGAVGFVEGRDLVTIESAAFATEDFQKADEIVAQRERRELIYTLIRYGTIALFIFLFFGFVIRPFIRWVTGLSSTKVEKILPKTVEELEQIQDVTTNALPGLASLPLLEEKVDMEKAESELLKEKLISLVDITPGKAAQIITDWIVQADLMSQAKKSKRR
ncbi:MAG: flagellar M-ring protein FliF [Proteobacteria bacterium]|nr:flagellar M-ring protein FliF [Pseudomonadota bacterium]